MSLPSRNDYRYTGGHRAARGATTTAWLGVAERALTAEHADAVRRTCALVGVATLAACALLLVGAVAWQPAVVTAAVLACLGRRSGSFA